MISVCSTYGLVRGYITGVPHAVLAKPAYFIHVWRGGEERKGEGQGWILARLVVEM